MVLFCCTSIQLLYIELLLLLYMIQYGFPFFVWTSCIDDGSYSSSINSRQKEVHDFKAEGVKSKNKLDNQSQSIINQSMHDIIAGKGQIEAICRILTRPSINQRQRGIYSTRGRRCRQTYNNRQPCPKKKSTSHDQLHNTVVSGMRASRLLCTVLVLLGGNTGAREKLPKRHRERFI